MLVAGRQWAPNVAAGMVGQIELVGAPQLAQVTSTPAAATITFSPAPSAGDVVYVWMIHTSVASLSLATSGYTEIASGGGFSVKAWRKIMGATPDTFVTSGVNISGNALMMGAIVLRGVRKPTPEDATPVMADNVTPAITTNTPGAWVLALYAAVRIGDIADIATGPAGYDNFVDGASGMGSSAGVALAAATKLIVTPTTENPGEYTGTWATSAGITIAVRKQ